MFDRVNTVIIGKTAGVADVDAPAGNVLAVVDISSAAVLLRGVSREVLRVIECFLCSVHTATRGWFVQVPACGVSQENKPTRALNGRSPGAS